jgi:hypothetical protein
MQDGKYAEACPKFAESHRLDPATGTLLNLAACHEAEKKLATAWLEYAQAEALARQDRREDRIRFAHEHSLAIEPRLARLAVGVEAAADLPNLEVTLDGFALKSAARGVPAPVDPGEHVIEARAPGRKPWSRRVVIEREAQQETVSVPVLEREPPAPVPSPSPEAPRPPAVAPPAVATTRPVPGRVYLAAGTTVLLAVPAAITGYAYMKERSRDGSVRSEDKQVSLGIANGVLTGLAVISAGATVYLYLTRPSRIGAPPAEGRFIGVAPMVAAGGPGFSIEGTL